MAPRRPDRSADRSAPAPEGISDVIQGVVSVPGAARPTTPSVPEGETAVPRELRSTPEGAVSVPVTGTSGHGPPYLRPNSPVRRNNAVAAEELAQSSTPQQPHESGTAKSSEHVYWETSQAAASAGQLQAGSQRKSQDAHTPRHNSAKLTKQSHVPQALTHRHQDQPARPTVVLARLATLRSPFHWLNWTWAILFTALLPAWGSIVWYGVIPVGPSSGDIGDKALWTFLINPLSFSFLSYLLLSLFFTALDVENPHRPFFSYAHILVATYVVMVLMPGLPVLLDEPFEMVALVCIGLTCLITLVGIRLTPRAWISQDAEMFTRAWKAFVRIVITFVIWSGILAGYMIANAQTDGAGQGLITVALTIIGFIIKKCNLQFADPVNLETAMLVAGLWSENLSDVFVTLAFPTINDVGPAFATIFLLRLFENLVYLFFQLNLWFSFRVWIKGKFKKDQGPRIEEDLPEYDDDRGHSAFHPGYRRRQLRFLVMKIFSQVSAYLYFLALAPVLRFGPNKRRFPYSDPGDDNIDGDTVDPKVELQQDTLLSKDLQYLSKDSFWQAMVFACIQIVATLASGLVVWLWMHRYHRNIIVSVRERYNAVVVKSYHYGLVLSVLLVNSLIATSYLQIYYRVYFV